MTIGDKIPISDPYSNIKVDTLEKLIFECKYFRCFTLEKLDGYFKDDYNFPKTKQQKEEYNIFLNMANREINKLK